MKPPPTKAVNDRADVSATADGAPGDAHRPRGSAADAYPRLGLRARFRRLLMGRKGMARHFAAAHAALSAGRPAEAAARFRRLAEIGHAEAQFWLGTCYAEGRGVVRNMPEAVAWMRRAAEQGHAKAQRFLGQVLTAGLSRVREFHDPLRFYGTPDAADDPVARANRDLLFPAGIDVERDEAEGTRWFVRASESGDPLAQVHVARKMVQSSGDGRNPEKTLELLLSAAAANCSDAHVELGRIYQHGMFGPPDRAAARRHLEAAAEQGAVEARIELAVLSAEAGDHAAAVRMFELAAEDDHPYAIFNLGVCYVKGQGVEANPYKAAALFRRAAKSKHEAATLAEVALGRLLESGNGVEQDCFEASLCYRRAAERGNARAQLGLGLLYMQGKGVLRDDRMAAEFLEKAAKQNLPEACVNLSLLHVRGRLGAPDPVAALAWIERALALVPPARRGSIETIRASLLKQLSPETIEEARRRLPAVTGAQPPAAGTDS